MGSQPVIWAIPKHAAAFQLLQFCSVKSWPAGISSLATRRSNIQRQERPDEAVLSPTLCPPHHFGDSDVMVVSAATEGAVKHMPLFRSGVHPYCLVPLCLTKQCVGDGEAVLTQKLINMRPLELSFPVP